MSRAECCPTCGGSRYCAPLRCYCGHEDCPAFASFMDITAVDLSVASTAPRHSTTAWDNRGEGSWIDKL